LEPSLTSSQRSSQAIGDMIDLILTSTRRAYGR
jgi:hypothetical protein